MQMYYLMAGNELLDSRLTILTKRICFLLKMRLSPESFLPSPVVQAQHWWKSLLLMKTWWNDLEAIILLVKLEISDRASAFIFLPSPTKLLACEQIKYVATNTQFITQMVNSLYPDLQLDTHSAHNLYIIGTVMFTGICNRMQCVILFSCTYLSN